VSGTERTGVVWLDGHLQPRDAATVSVTDLGLRSGWGVFETLRVDVDERGPRLLAAAQHGRRLTDGAVRLGIVGPDDAAAITTAFEAALTALLDHVTAHTPPAGPDRATPGDLVLRATLTAGPLEEGVTWPPRPAGRPTLLVTVHDAPVLPAAPAPAVTVTARRWPADVKSTSYVASVLANREARARGAEVALLVDGDEVLEAAEGNVFAVIDGVLRTPAADGRLLDGVTRSLVLAAAARLGLPTLVGPVRVAELRRAERAFTTSAVQRIRLLSSVDGSPLSTDPDPVITALRSGLTAG
jgi:4-amino-4-deoxychorismate lyase